MKIGKNTFTEKKDAGTALASAIVAKANQDAFVTIGEFARFELRAIKQGAEYIGHITGKQAYKFNIYLENTTYMVNHIIGIVENLENRIQNWTNALEDTKVDLAAQQKLIAEPFAKQAELEQKLSRYNEVMSILNPKEEQTIADDVQYQARYHLDEEGENYGNDSKTNNEDWEKNSSGMVRGQNKANSRGSSPETTTAGSWVGLGREKQRQLINLLGANPFVI